MAECACQAPARLPNPSWNTCYANAVLQLVDASARLSAHVRQLAEDQDAAQARQLAQQPVTAGLVASLRRWLTSSWAMLLRGVRAPPAHRHGLSTLLRHGAAPGPPAPSSDQWRLPPPPNVQAPLASSLVALMEHMGHGTAQPASVHQEGRAVPVRVVREVLAELSEHMPGAQLHLGEQQDVEEALLALCSGLQAEAAAVSHVHSAGLLGLLHAPSGLGASSSPAAVGVAGEQTPGPEHAAPGGGAVPQHLRGERRAWHPPLGLTAQELTCVACGTASTRQLTPFWALQLPLPARRDVQSGLHLVPPGTSLLACMRAWARPNHISGRTCDKCTLKGLSEWLQNSDHQSGAAATRGALPALLLHPHAGAWGAAPRPLELPTHRSHRSAEEQRAAREAAALAGFPGPLPEVDVDALLHGALGRAAAAPSGLAQQLKARRDAVQMTSVVHVPDVLCVHLQRSQWDAAGHPAKVHGHVLFPLQLTLRELRDALNGRQQQPAHTSRDGAAPQGEESVQATQADHAPVRRLCAVVAHVGVGSQSGHYFVLRRGRQRSACPCRRWWCASDSEVFEVAEPQVLRAEATLLLYERCNTS